jgi:hypothetical protein
MALNRQAETLLRLPAGNRSAPVMFTMPNEAAHDDAPLFNFRALVFEPERRLLHSRRRLSIAPQCVLPLPREID